MSLEQKLQEVKDYVLNRISTSIAMYKMDMEIKEIAKRALIIMNSYQGEHELNSIQKIYDKVINFAKNYIPTSYMDYGYTRANEISQ